MHNILIKIKWSCLVKVFWPKQIVSWYTKGVPHTAERQFTLAIAYLLPGFVGIAGVGFHSEQIRSWLAISPDSLPTVGAFLYLSLASLAAGLTLSAVRWAIVDFAHHKTGITPPKLDFGKLEANLLAFTLAVEHNYRYYQFYANMLVAVAMLFICMGTSEPTRLPLVAILAVVVLEVVLWFASRDCLKRYYHRIGQILRPENA